MLSTEQFFAAFSKAGIVKSLSWCPKSGDAQQTADVIFRAPSRDALAGEFSATDYMIEYPATQLVGLKRGEQVTVESVTYKVREGPHSDLDGSRLKAFLTRES